MQWWVQNESQEWFLLTLFGVQGSRPKREQKIILSSSEASFFRLRSLRRLSFLAEVQMALLAGFLRPSALLGPRRRYLGSKGERPSATDRLCRSPQHLLVSPPAAASLFLHHSCQRHGQRTSLLVTLAAAASGAAAGSDSQEQPQQKPTFQQRLAAAAQASSKKRKKKPLPARLLSSFLATSSVPYR